MCVAWVSDWPSRYISLTTRWPPRRTTRSISASTGPGFAKWWSEFETQAVSNESSGKARWRASICSNRMSGVSPNVVVKAAARSPFASIPTISA